MIVLLERCFEGEISQLGTEEEITPRIGLEDVKIPFFYIPSTKEAEA